jgi:hypothetical protein
MEGRDIYAGLKTHSKTKHCFQGIYPINLLPSKHTVWKTGDKKYIIINTDPSYGPGEHWFALCLSKNGVHEYFDSYGQEPSKKIQKYLGNNYLYLTYPLQDFLTTTCGQWCMYYILHKCFGGTLSQLIKTLSFLRRPFEKDIYINKVISQEFPIKEPVIHTDFLWNQIAQPREKKKKKMGTELKKLIGPV